VHERDQRVGGVKAEGAVANEADLAVEAFEAAAGEAEPDRGEDAVAVLAQRAREPDERPNRDRDAQLSQASMCARPSASSQVDHPDLTQKVGQIRWGPCVCNCGHGSAQSTRPTTAATTATPPATGRRRPIAHQPSQHTRHAPRTAPATRRNITPQSPGRSNRNSTSARTTSPSY
jgi:hypothetical protein